MISTEQMEAAAGYAISAVAALVTVWKKTKKTTQLLPAVEPEPPQPDRLGRLELRVDALHSDQLLMHRQNQDSQTAVVNMLTQIWRALGADKEKEEESHGRIK